jgi:Caspase domain
MNAHRDQVPQTSPASESPEQASHSQQQDRAALEDSRLRSVWEDAMKEGVGPSIRHHKATVLMISWAYPLDTLGTAAEVDALGVVFSEKFNYTVLKNQIEDNGKLAQIQASKFLADLVYHHDEENSLLIIYYAGHGEGGDPGKLTLRR